MIQPDLWRPEWVPRPSELHALQQLLVVERRRAVLIIGSAATGKSVLLQQFIARHTPDFSGGVKFVDGWGEEVSDVPNFIRDLNQWTLLAVDGLDERSAPAAWQSEFERLARFRRLQILATTRPQPLIRIDWPTLQLGGMDPSELEQLLSLNGLELTGFPLDAVVRRLQGNPLAATLVAERLRQRDPSTLAADLERLLKLDAPALLGPDGRPLQPRSESLELAVAEVKSVSNELIKELAREPNLLYELHPRRFEEVVAELLFRLGYEVELTSASKDGDVDIYATTKGALGRFLYLVECKRYGPRQRVEVGIVRQLYGVVQAKQAAGGVVATTSFFTRGAQDFQRDLKFQLNLKDFFAIKEWLEQVNIPE